MTFQTLDSFQNIPSPSPPPYSSAELSDLIQGQRNERSAAFALNPHLHSYNELIKNKQKHTHFLKAPYVLSIIRTMKFSIIPSLLYLLHLKKNRCPSSENLFKEIGLMLVVRLRIQASTQQPPIHSQTEISIFYLPWYYRPKVPLGQGPLHQKLQWKKILPRAVSVRIS